MSSPSAAGVVRRRSMKSWLRDTLHSAARRMSRQLDVRVNTTSFSSAGVTSCAPANSSEATSIESCRPTAGRSALAAPDWAWARRTGIAHSKAASRRWKRRDRSRTDGSSVTSYRTRAKNGPRAQVPLLYALRSIKQSGSESVGSESTDSDPTDSDPNDSDPDWGGG